MTKKMVKEAIAPSDFTQAVRSAKMAKDYYSGKYHVGRDQAKKFLSRRLGKLDVGLSSLQDASSELGEFAREGRDFFKNFDSKALSDSTKKTMRSMRNLSIVGGGAIAAMLAWKYHQEKMKMEQEGESLRLTKEASNRNILRSALRTAAGVARAAKPYISADTIPNVIGGASELGGNMHNKIIDKRERRPDKYWQNFTNRYPEYEGNALAREHFDVIVDFNPSTAKHPIVVKSMLDATTYQGGDQLFGLQMVSNLADVESSRSRTDQQRLRQIAEAIRTPLMEASKGIVNLSDAVLDREREVASRNARIEELMRQRTKSPLEQEMLLIRAGKDYGDYLRAQGVENPRPEDIEAHVNKLRDLAPTPVDDFAFRTLVRRRVNDELERMQL